MTDELNLVESNTVPPLNLDEYINSLVEKRVAEALEKMKPAETLENYTVPDGKVLVLRTSQYVYPHADPEPRPFLKLSTDTEPEPVVEFDPETWEVRSIHSKYVSGQGYIRFQWPKEFGAHVELDEDFDPTPHCGAGLHGLMWGYGEESYLNEDHDYLCWQIVEVDEDSVVHVDGSKVKFPRCRMILSTPARSEAVKFLHKFAPVLDENLAAYKKMTGAIPRAVFSQDFVRNRSYTDNFDNCVETEIGPMSNLISSRIKNSQDMHAPVLDLDYGARVTESSTPGHFHLTLDVAVPWKKYKKFLKAAAEAGIIEPGYYEASVRRGGTFLRLPWVRKWKVEEKKEDNSGDPF